MGLGDMYVYADMFWRDVIVYSIADAYGGCLTNVSYQTREREMELSWYYSIETGRRGIWSE